MDAVKFVKEEIRMCAESKECCNCPLDDTIYCSASPRRRSQEEVEEIVRRVETWSAEHPRKTRLGKFLEQYPEATLNALGVIPICPLNLIKNHENSAECARLRATHATTACRNSGVRK